MVPSIERLSRYFTLGCLLLSVIVLAGWQFDISVFKQPIKGLMPMTPMVAMAFLFSCVSLLALHAGFDALRNMSVVLSAICILVGALRLLESIGLSPLTIDDALYASKVSEQVFNDNPARMSYSGAFNFVLTGIALILTRFNKWLFAQLLSIAVGFLAWLSVLGYIYKVPEFYGEIPFVPMSVHAAVGFILLSLAVFFFNPHRNIAGQVTRQTFKGFTSRLELPVIFLLPMVVGFIFLLGSWEGQFSTEFGVALLVVTLSVLIGGLVYNNIKLGNASHAQHQELNKELYNKNEEIRSLLDEVTSANNKLVVYVEELSATNEQLNQASEKIKYQSELLVRQKNLEIERSRESLSKTEANLRTIFDHTEDIFLLIDKDYRIVMFNHTTVSWLSNRLKEGVSLLDIIPPIGVEGMKDKLSRVAGGETIRYDVKVPDGADIRWLHVIIAAIKQRGEVTGYCFTTTDLTIIRRSEENLRRTVEQLNERNNDLMQFSFVASHILRAPVASIKGLLNLIKTNELEGEAPMIFTMIKQSTMKLESVIYDLSQILETRNLSLQQKERVSIRMIVEDLENDLFQHISQTNTVVEIDDSAIASFFTIRSYMVSIFYHLITNSIRFRARSRDPLIKIVTFENEEEEGFTIEDNGSGLDLDRFGEKIFNLYQRFHLDVDGRGLGLYLVKTQVHLLNGMISIESKVDVGTKFKIVFPRH